MIHINLVGGDRRAPKPGPFTLNAAQKIGVVGSLVMIVTAVGIGWRYWALTQSEERVVAEVAAARREESRLSEVLTQVAEFEAQRAQLQQRVTLIDELRRGQSAPVHIIDQISRSLPEMTWLTSLRQTNYDVTIRGQCLSLTALSDFVGNLEATRYFKRPVEIVASEAVVARDGTELIAFEIKGTFQMAGIDPPAPPAKPAKKAGKGGKLG